MIPSIHAPSTALLVIDPFNDFLAEGGKLWPHLKAVAEELDTLSNLKGLISAARRAGVPVFYVPHHRSAPGDFSGWRFLSPSHAGALRLAPFERGSWGGQFHPELQPLEWDVIVQEHWHHSGFAGTDLDHQLRIRGIDHVIVAGLRGNTCVEATGRYAVELGYHTTLVRDATATFRREEWVATMEVNALSFAHEVLSTSQVVGRLGDAGDARSEPLRLVG